MNRVESRNSGAQIVKGDIANGAIVEASLGKNEVSAGKLKKLTSLSVMQLGDSLVTGSSPAPGGSRIELWRLARSVGVPLSLVGPVAQGNLVSSTDLRPEPGDPFCAGYPGETISQLKVRCQSGGSIYAWIAARGAPDIILVGPIGSNDANAGATAAQMYADLLLLLAELDSIAPNALKVVKSIPLFYTGSSPVGGIAAANTVVAAYNALLRTGIPARGDKYSFLDACAGLTIADTYTDGIHLRPEGQAKCGAREFAHILTLLPGAILTGDRVPRPHRIRTATPMVSFTATSDKLENGSADNGWQIPAGNFLFGACYMFSTLPAALTNLAYSAPGALNYTHGFQLMYDGVSSAKVLNFYAQFGGASVVITKQVPSISAKKPFYVFVHGDRALGVVSLWMAIPEKGRQGPWTVYCLGEVTGLPPWSASDVNPKIHLGNYSDLGFIGALGNVFMANTPVGRADIRRELEAIVYDGTNPQGITASLPITEGSGTTAASNVGGQSATLTGGGWYAAGVVPRPGDDKPPVVTGAKGGNVALTNLLAQLDADNIITDSTS